MRNAFLIIGAALVVIIIISVAASSGGGAKHPSVSSSVSAASAAPSTAATTAAPSLPPAQAKFVRDLRDYMSNKGVSNSASDATLADLGHQVCKIRRSGGGQSSVIGAMGNKSEADFSMGAGKFVRLAEKDLCHQELPQVLTYSGSSNWNSPPFNVSSGTVTVTYSYSNNQDSNFIADMVAGDQGDDQSIANDIGTAASKTTTLYPSEVGSQYHLEITASGAWTIKIQM